MGPPARHPWGSWRPVLSTWRFHSDPRHTRVLSKFHVQRIQKCRKTTDVMRSILPTWTCNMSSVQPRGILQEVNHLPVAQGECAREIQRAQIILPLRLNAALNHSEQMHIMKSQRKHVKKNENKKEHANSNVALKPCLVGWRVTRAQSDQIGPPPALSWRRHSPPHHQTSPEEASLPFLPWPVDACGSS